MPIHSPLAYESRIRELEAEVERLQAIADAVSSLDADSVRVMDALPSWVVVVEKSVIDRIQEAWLAWKEAAQAKGGADNP